jgi:hypothetical protein
MDPAGAAGAARPPPPQGPAGRQARYKNATHAGGFASDRTEPAPPLWDPRTTSLQWAAWPMPWTPTTARRASCRRSRSGAHSTNRSSHPASRYSTSRLLPLSATTAHLDQTLCLVLAAALPLMAPAPAIPSVPDPHRRSVRRLCAMTFLFHGPMMDRSRRVGWSGDAYLFRIISVAFGPGPVARGL